MKAEVVLQGKSRYLFFRSVQAETPETRPYFYEKFLKSMTTHFECDAQRISIRHQIGAVDLESGLKGRIRHESSAGDHARGWAAS